MKLKQNNFFKISAFFQIMSFMLINLSTAKPNAYAEFLNAGQCSTLAIKVNIASVELQDVFKGNDARIGLMLSYLPAAPKNISASEKIIPKSKHLVLFICNANQERSPMAASLMNLNMPDDLKDYFFAESSGLLASNKVDFTLMNYLDRHPLLRNHAPKQVTEQRLKDAKIIFVMTPGQQKRLLDKYPYLSEKVFLLMGDDSIHGVAGDYTQRGPSYKVLEKAISGRLPIIQIQLRQILALEQSDSLPKEAEAININESLINTAI